MKEFAKFILKTICNIDITDDDLEFVLREYYRKKVSTKKRGDGTAYLEVKAVAKMWEVSPNTARSFIKQFPRLTKSCNEESKVSVHFIGYLFLAYEYHRLTGMTPRSISKMPKELLKQNLAIQRE